MWQKVTDMTEVNYVMQCLIRYNPAYNTNLSAFIRDFYASQGKNSKGSEIAVARIKIKRRNLYLHELLKAYEVLNSQLDIKLSIPDDQILEYFINSYKTNIFDRLDLYCQITHTTIDQLQGRIDYTKICLKNFLYTNYGEIAPSAVHSIQYGDKRTYDVYNKKRSFIFPLMISQMFPEIKLEYYYKYDDPHMIDMINTNIQENEEKIEAMRNEDRDNASKKLNYHGNNAGKKKKNKLKQKEI